MGKKRIHELAKELSMSSAELIQKIMEWDLLPGVKLVASSGIEDYMADEIGTRLGRPVGGDSVAAPQVVRRRKKSSSVAVEGGKTTASSVSGLQKTDEDDKMAVAAQTPVAAAEPDKAADELSSNHETPASDAVSKGATAGEAVKPSRLKDAQVKKNVPATIIGTKPLHAPDFLKLSPAAEKASDSVEVQATPEKQPVPSPAADQAATQRAKPVDVEEKSSSSHSAKPYGKEKIVQGSRKVTHEIGETAAKIISPPRAGFEAAKVIGSKPNWKEASGFAGGRHSDGPGRRTQEGGGQGDWRSRKEASGDSGAAKAATSGRPDFRRPAPNHPVIAAVAPSTEAESRRRDKDKKKKSHSGGRFDGDDSFQGAKSSRRREVVERVDLYSDGDWERVRRRGKGQKKLKAKAESTVPKAIKRRIKVDDVITVSELAHRLSMKAGDIIKKLMSMGVLASLNQALDFDTATLVAAEFGYEVEKSSFDEENILQIDYGSDDIQVARPPVVTIMGHVDHGKTSLLDYIRETNIQSGEAGGITQHIGAYHVTAAGRNITFLDTPGHEAFTAMRSRGAQVTDIVVLIVAADDGVMPQTKEAADHAKAAEVPIIVAINKVDKPTADPERVRREMMEIGLVPEAWGGDTVFVELSAKTGLGVDDLLDMILLQADILELTARPSGLAKGRIIEARLDKGRGPVATVLVQDGLLKQGDAYVCGVFCGRIRAMLDDHGQRVEEAGPSIPIEVQGISGVPQAGDEFIALADEKQARQVSQHRLMRQRESELTKTSKLTLENLFDNIKAGAVKGLNLIVKADVQGSLEAIVDAVLNLSTQDMKINVIHQSTGAASETDIMLACASNALIISFNVRPSTKVQEMAEAENIQIRYYDVIYQLIDDIKEAMAGLLDPVKSEKIIGRAEVRAVFAVSKVGTIAGSYVTDGKIIRGARARLLRDGVVIHDGRLSSLKRLKDDVREVNSSYECGIGFESYNDIKMGDHIEAYQIEETAATVDLIDEALAREAQERATVAKEAKKSGETEE